MFLPRLLKRLTLGVPVPVLRGLHALGFGDSGPVDRCYIEGFLERPAADVRGRVVEIADDTYTRRYGGDRVTRSDVLHPVPGNPRATLVGDMAVGDGLPSAAFDCIICTQTLPFIYDVRAAIRTLHRCLAPGGVLLATLPGISQVARYDRDRWGDYWRFTDLASRRLFEEVFPRERLTLETHGNVLTAISFLHGLGVCELRPGDLDHQDSDYQVTIGVRAIREETG